MVSVVKELWTIVNGCRIYVRTATPDWPAEGAPTFVLVHGLLISSRYMTPTMERLGLYYRLYAPDLPGFGKSQNPPQVLTVEGVSDALIAWMDAMCLSQAVFLGNSLGGQILIDLGARYPERVQGLVLVGPTVDPSARTVIQVCIIPPLALWPRWYNILLKKPSSAGLLRQKVRPWPASCAMTTCPR